MTIKGGRSNSNNYTDAYYLQLPIDTKLHFPVSKKVDLTAAAGPYVAYGLFGKIKQSTANGGTEKYNTLGSNGTRRFDAGADFEIGVEFNDMILSCGYELGLAKLNKDKKCYNSNININVGFKF